METPILCSYEDRPGHFTGWKLLLLSLQKHAPELKVHLFSKHFPKTFFNWAERHDIEAAFHTLEPSNLLGWNNKPKVIQAVFDLGFDRVLWVDSDVLITCDISHRLRELQEEAVVVTEENGTFDDLRITCHDLEVMRRWKNNPNTCLIHFNRRVHEELVEAWRKRLEGPYFQQMQALHDDHRPIYCWSEQDVLTGLLCGKPPDGFGHLPLERFHLVEDIIHCATSHRIRYRLSGALRKLPLFLHAQGMKPWDPKVSTLPTLERLQIELSVYVSEAAHYSEHLDEDVSWIHQPSRLALLLHRMAMGNPHLRGIPSLLLSDLLHPIKNRVQADLPEVKSQRTP